MRLLLRVALEGRQAGLEIGADHPVHVEEHAHEFRQEWRRTVHRPGDLHRIAAPLEREVGDVVGHERLREIESDRHSLRGDGLHDLQAWKSWIIAKTSSGGAAITMLRSTRKSSGRVAAYRRIAAVVATRNNNRRLSTVLLRFGWAVRAGAGQREPAGSWRTRLSSSMSPVTAAKRLLHSAASARDCTSRRQKPATSSFDSAKGPSITRHSPPRKRRRWPLELGPSATAITNTPAFSISTWTVAMAAARAARASSPASKEASALCISM